MLSSSDLILNHGEPAKVFYSSDQTEFRGDNHPSSTEKSESLQIQMKTKTKHKTMNKTKRWPNSSSWKLPFFFLSSAMGNGRKLLKERQGWKAQTDLYQGLRVLLHDALGLES